MHKFFFLLCFLLPFTVWGQEKEIIARFVITSGKDGNGKDLSAWLLENQIVTIFYTYPGKKQIYMANISYFSENMSYGPISDFNSDVLQETGDTYKTDIFTFDWHYTNSYDGKSGTISVLASKVFTDQFIDFNMSMIIPGKGTTLYRGYMEGDFNFERFNVKAKESPANRFTVNTDYVCYYITGNTEWSDWTEKKHSFIINNNENGDVKHFAPNAKQYIYKRLSNTTRGSAPSGEPYQSMQMLDEKGERFEFQIFDDKEIGVIIRYESRAIQYSIRL